MRTMDTFDEYDVKPETAAKAKELLGGITEDEVAFTAASVAPIVKWVCFLYLIPIKTSSQNTQYI